MKTKFLNSSGVKISLNRNNLKKEIFGSGQKIISNKLIPIIQEKIDDAQKEMVDEFQEHPITKEILAGPNSINSSGVLGGYGNLFSFIGFNQGENQIEPLSKIFERRIPFIIRSAGGRGKYYAQINAPDKSELQAIAQVSWMGGRSWLDGIERGIAGLNRYLYDPSYSTANSRSGMGIQVKNSITSVTQTRTTYVSKIISNFKKRLTRL